MERETKVPAVDDKLYSKLYDAVVGGDIVTCRKWLEDFALHTSDGSKYEETLVSVGERIYEEFRKIGGNIAASKYIMMTEVLTGFTEEQFMFLGEGEMASDIVELAGKLSVAAEEAIPRKRRVSANDRGGAGNTCRSGVH